jgi:hypothetical protein
VGAGSASEGADAFDGNVASLVARGTLADESAKAGRGESEANAAAPSAIAETLRTLLVMETSI